MANPLPAFGKRQLLTSGTVVGFDLSNPQLDGSAAGATVSRGFDWGNNGDVLVLASDASPALLVEFTPISSYTISGMTASGTTENIEADMDNPFNFSFSDNGNHANVFGLNTGDNASLVQYPLSTAYDITTRGAKKTYAAGQRIEDGKWVNNGASLIYISQVGGITRMYRANASTNYDPTTLGSSTEVLNFPTDFVLGFDFSPDGRLLYTHAISTPEIVKWTMVSAFLPEIAVATTPVFDPGGRRYLRVSLDQDNLYTITGSTFEQYIEG